MKRFLVLYTAPPNSNPDMSGLTPEQIAEGMKPWLDWREKMGEHLVDLGTPLLPASRLTPAGEQPTASASTGYSIIQAESAEAARELLADHPHLGWDPACAIDIHECVPMPV